MLRNAYFIFYCIYLLIVYTYLIIYITYLLQICKNESGATGTVLLKKYSQKRQICSWSNAKQAELLAQTNEVGYCNKHDNEHTDEEPTANAAPEEPPTISQPNNNKNSMDKIHYFIVKYEPEDE